MTTGIHHVTALTGDVQANVDFYTGFLGLRLVKRTAGFEDAEQLHLFYGDEAGSPGSLISFLVWQDGGAGRVGLGQVSEIAFAVPPASLGDWLTRALAAGVPVEGPVREFGESTLRLKDPDGVIVKLVASDMPAAAPLPRAEAPTRLRSVTLLTGEPEEARAMLARFGYRQGPEAGAIRRMVSETDAVDVRAVAGFPQGIQGAGTVDHVAFRAPGAEDVRAMAGELPGMVNMHDRKYFFSLYVRDTGEQLYEFASDGPGFGIDEPAETLGTRLFTPPGEAGRAEDLAVTLPAFALPGEPRWPRRRLLFTHRIHTPEAAGDRVLILLHGSGGDETSLLPFGHRLDPAATLIGVRGRATEEGHPRWFRRFGPEEFDQADIRAEAEAFAAFLPDLAGLYGFDPARAVFVGYSNGANFLAAVARLEPGTLRRALLLRARDVLSTPAAAREEGSTAALAIQGSHDPIVGAAGEVLAAALRAAGVAAALAEVDAGHDLVPADLEVGRAWLDA